MKPILLLLTAALFFASCKKQDVPADNDNNTNNPAPGIVKGKVTGKVVTNNNKTAVRNAIVFVADSGNIYHTYTDVDGNFILEAPAGQRELNIQSGTGKIFRTKVNVNIEANKVTLASLQSLKLGQVANLAFVPGTYDKIEAILMDSLGYMAQPINSNHLHSLNALSQFNAIFINCTSSMQTDPIMDSVLGAYVANGGSIYASDYAVAALIGMVGGTCPAPRNGGFIPDQYLCTQRAGASGMLNNTSISSTALQTYLNKNTMNVKYDMGQWETVMNYEPNFWEVLVMNPQNQMPLLLRTSSYTNNAAGSVNVGNINNNNMVTICHKPQGATPVTITIPSADLAAHLAHGDSVGSCQSVNGAGRVYYTTFHTQPNGIISPDMKHILDYIILNL